MEIVQQLAELRIVDGAMLLFAKVALNELAVQLERYLRMQVGLLDDVREIGCKADVCGICAGL